ncbi:MAG: hypothetical protein ACOCZ8_04405 [Bacteroidota bacterium]
MRKITELIDVLDPSTRRSVYIQVRNTSAKKKSRRLDLLKSMIAAADAEELAAFESQEFTASDERQLQYLFQQVLEALVRLDNRDEFQLYDRLKHIDILLKYERFNLARQEIDRLKSDLLEDSQALVRLLTARQEALTIERNASLDSLEEHHQKIKHRLQLIDEYHREVEFEKIYLELIFLHGKHPRGSGKDTIETALQQIDLDKLERVNRHNFVQTVYYHRSKSLVHRLKEEPLEAAEQLEQLKALIGKTLREHPEKRHEYVETSYELAFCYIHAGDYDAFKRELDSLYTVVQDTPQHVQHELFSAYLYVMTTTGAVQFKEKENALNGKLLEAAEEFILTPGRHRNLHLRQTILFLFSVIYAYRQDFENALSFANRCYNTEDIFKRPQLYLHLQFFRVFCAMMTDSWDFAEHTLNQLTYFSEKEQLHIDRLKPLLKVQRAALQHTDRQRLVRELQEALALDNGFPEDRFMDLAWLLEQLIEH